MQMETFKLTNGVAKVKDYRHWMTNDLKRGVDRATSLEKNETLKASRVQNTQSGMLCLPKADDPHPGEPFPSHSIRKTHSREPIFLFPAPPWLYSCHGQGSMKIYVCVYI